MQLNNWKLFDKHGSPLNWYADDYLSLNFAGDVSSAMAAGYLITDPSGTVVDAQITNSGFYYYDPTSVTYDYVFGDNGVDITSDVSIVYTDVSIFNPDPVNTQGIGSLADIDVSGNFLYPSTVYSSALFLNPVSQGLVETEHLYILEDFGNDVIGRPYDPSTSTLVFRMLGEEDEIKFFTVDADLEDVTWTDELVFDISTYSLSTPITLNVGFRSDAEGVFERSIRIYNVIDGIYYTMGEIVVNAEAIGEDERFRTLLGNFGLPDPKDFPHMFKEADINEALPDYEIINPKSKYMILEHAQIMPYVGTYKALINALKWLGYDDIYIREWFKNVKENKKLSLIVPYDAKDRTQTILKFSAAERQALKKLNQLSLNYCITRETGELDEWGTPETENCYEYNIEEVFVKLVSLKKWLEKNIIGVNARIIDITGEGVYFERYINLIWATDNLEFDYSGYATLTPATTPDFSELIMGESSINMTLKEYEQTIIGFEKNKISDYINYVWDPSTGESLSPSDPSYLADPDHYLEVGPPLSHPFVDITEIQWKASVSKTESGVLTNNYVTNPLWIYQNEIKFYNLFDSSTIFYDSSLNLSLILEEAYIRDASNNDWVNSAEYHIYPNYHINMDSSTEKTFQYPGTYFIEDGSGTIYGADPSVIHYNTSPGALYNPTKVEINISAIVHADTSTRILSPLQDGWVMESSSGEVYEYDDYVWFSPDNSLGNGSILQYAFDQTYRVPLLSFKNFRSIDANNNVHTFETDKLYHLDILDGKISMDTFDPSVGEDVRTYINFHYDIDSSNQNIELNVEYISPRMPLYVVDPSAYYWADPTGLSGGDSSLSIDNSIYTMTVNHIGDYNVEVFAWDGYNSLYYNHIREPHDVYIKSPIIYTITNSNSGFDVSISSVDVNTLMSENALPIFEREVPYLGLTLEQDINGENYIKIPSITYFQQTPELNAIDKFYIASEQVIEVGGSTVEVVKLYEDFLDEDDVILIKTYKGSYMPVAEASSHVTAGGGTSTLTLDNIPSEFVLDGSHNIYIHNITERATSNIVDDLGNITFSLDVSEYTFLDNQLVNIIVRDTCTGYEWGSSYRVIDVSGATHTFNMNFPQFIIDGSIRYDVTARHAYASFANYELDVSSASEISDNFEIYHDKDYRENFLDSTFVMLNIDFSQEYALDNWYDSSVGLDSSVYYLHDNAITVNTGDLVLLNALYDPCTYLLDQHNIWTVQENISKDTVFRVFNKRVPFVFNTTGYYDVIAESYDSYGNLASKIYPGLIHVE